MSRVGLGAIVAALGGDLYAGGRRASVPGPGHGPADRSLSLLLDGDRVVVHSFAGDDWRIALADLQARGLVDGDSRIVGAGPTTARASPRDPSPGARVHVARALWDGGLALTEASTAARYLRRRGVNRALADLHDLRAHPAAPLSVYRPTGFQRTALLAGIRGPNGEVTGVEITYLTADGRRAEHLTLPRKTLGVLPPGAAVRVSAPGPDLLVAEGLFTALSAGARFGLPCWALLSTANLRRWQAPPGVRRVLIAGDRGRDGERSAAILAGRLRRQGLATELRLPPPGRGDWNDLQCSGG